MKKDTVKKTTSTKKKAIEEKTTEVVEEVIELTPAEIAAEKLKEMGAQNVLISMGKDGALLVSEDNQVLISSVAKGEVVNSVGAGDSMVAGFISGYLKSQNYEDALRLGAASGGATAFSSDLAIREFIDKLVKEIKIQKIK